MPLKPLSLATCCAWLSPAALSSPLCVSCVYLSCVSTCVQEHWEKELPDLQLEWDVPFRWVGCVGVHVVVCVYMCVWGGGAVKVLA